MNRYLEDIIDFTTGFIKRKGVYILLAIIVSRIFSFLLTIFLSNSVNTESFGNISYAYNIISFIAPFAGFGIFQSLNRYGPITASQNQKKTLFQFVITRGSVASIFIVALIIIFSTLLTSPLPESNKYLMILSLFILNYFIFEVIKIYFRVYNINKLFAYLEIGHSLLTLLLGVTLTYFFNGTGYIVALVTSPLIISIFMLVKYKMLSQTTTNNYSKEHKKSLWSYGIYTSLGGLISQLIFSVDILTIGFIIQNPREVGLYKAASLVPFSLLFIPIGVMKTDLVKITQNYQNSAFLKNYVSNYLKIFIPISLVVFFSLYLLAEFIMLLFGDDYANGAPLITVFAFGLIGAFLFRNPFGNIITCVGWSKTNTIISVITLLLDVPLNIFLIQEYGIIGAAYATAILLWVAGLASYIAFLKYLNSLN